MRLMWFHLMPYTELPDDFREKHLFGMEWTFIRRCSIRSARTLCTSTTSWMRWSDALIADSMPCAATNIIPTVMG